MTCEKKTKGAGCKLQKQATSSVFSELIYGAYNDSPKEGGNLMMISITYIVIDEVMSQMTLDTRHLVLSCRY